MMIDWNKIATFFTVSDCLLRIIKFIINHYNVKNEIKKYLSIACLIIAIANNKDIDN